MPEPRRPALWWERWSAWWHDQTLYLKDPRLRGACRSRADVHVVTWEGTLKAAGRRWPIAIQWGPGTPFLPPRIYPRDCCSRFHQLLDLSMCLAPPASLREGWSGVPDLGFWIDQAVRWFEGYAGEGWAISPQEWLVHAPWLPAPEYRPALPPTMFVAVPPAWYEAKLAPSGIFHARLPRDRRGMGAVVSWRCSGEARHDWREAAALVESASDEVQGLWEAMPDPATGMAAPQTRLAQREQRRVVQKADARRKHMLSAAFCDLSGEPGDRVWMFSDPAASMLALSAMMFGPALAWPELLCRKKEMVEKSGPWPGVLLDGARLGARRVVGKERHVMDRIGAAHVMLVGLGALGSEVAHLLVREGVTRFTLVDGDLLLPENVARHRADLADAGRPKVEAMRRDILRGNPAATVDMVMGWLDDVVPSNGWSTSRPSLAIGLTGHEGSEHVLGDRCAELEIACLHAWLEVDGKALRLFRALPGRDPTLLELSRAPGTSIPYLPRGSAPDARVCAEMVRPGSAANVHAAANFVTRSALDVIAGQESPENHWIFAPEGLADPDPRIPRALGARYGVASWTLAKPGA